MKTGERNPSLRCAIYTRVSTEQGLEQEFNSLDNQREAGCAGATRRKLSFGTMSPLARDSTVISQIVMYQHDLGDACPRLQDVCRKAARYLRRRR
jgi:hypothetical protein